MFSENFFQTRGNIWRLHTVDKRKESHTHKVWGKFTSYLKNISWKWFSMWILWFCDVFMIRRNFWEKDSKTQCAIVNLISGIFGKNFVKATVLLNKLLKSWFDEICIYLVRVNFSFIHTDYWSALWHNIFTFKPFKYRKCFVNLILKSFSFRLWRIFRALFRSNSSSSQCANYRNHTSQIGDLVRSNFLSKNDNTIDLDYPCALQNTPVFSM